MPNFLRGKHRKAEIKFFFYPFYTPIIFIILKIMKRYANILRRFPAIFTMCVSWYLSSKEKVPMPDFENSDKFVHFVCFGGLSVCWSLWFSLESWRKKTIKSAAFCTIFTSVYGAIDEVHQSFTPGRFAGTDDWLADTAGAILGAVFCILAVKIWDLRFRRR